ncbi:MAG: hypothetical protein J7M10_01585 [Candidatus Cloacimonetes bacterium]|nr:hypothetical protein [Candidatus Cloacimonadota bacterium]
MEKTLSEITRREWIVWQWFEDTLMGDEDRRFLADFKRTPTEAMDAAEEWDFLKSVKESPEESAE